ncbi:ABC-2 transporter permease [Pseudogracilibacillus sp. SE30717A]|uniref:ABC-2 transporter permease n=1 Tax=Pseudogracilibacillus sp. SE30717A TaxID=3098293 RepID=UPI00300E1C29
MKGLILNNMYSIEKSMRTSILLSIAALIGLLLTEHSAAVRVAALLPFLLIPVQAFEILKLDSMSGWNKFEITLPVNREKIIQSKYITFFILLTFCVILAVGLFFITNIFIETSFSSIFFLFMLRGMGIVLCLATLLYPLTYVLGVEKSDTIMLYCIGFAFGMFGLVFFGLELIPGTIENIDFLFSVTYCLLSFILFIISYFIANFIYKRKEF